MLGPLEVVLHGADRALRRADPDQAAEPEQRDEPGPAGERAADTQEARPCRDVYPGSQAKRCRNTQQQQGEEADESGTTEKACADAGFLELRRDLGLRELDLLVHEQRQVARSCRDELAERLVVATAHVRSPRSRITRCSASVAYPGPGRTCERRPSRGRRPLARPQGDHAPASLPAGDKPRT